MNVFTQIRIRKGEHFLRQGEIEDRIGYIYKGFLRYYYITKNGDDVTKHFAMENNFVAAYSSLIYQKPTMYGIIAEEDTTILVIGYKAYFSLIEQYRIWERIARLYTENVYNFKEMREADLLLKDAKTRYIEFKVAYPNIEKRLKQRHIATFLGIHPASLSRIKKDTNFNIC